MASKMEKLRLDVEELTKLTEMASRQSVKDILTVETRKLQTEITRMMETEGGTISASVGSSITKNPKPYSINITNYCWDQTSNFVELFVSLENVESLSAENIHCDFTPKSLELSVKNLNGKNYVLTLPRLNDTIDPKGSYWKVKRGKVVVYLKKEKVGQWKDIKEIPPKIPKFKDEDLAKDDDPSRNLMNIMKKMYDEGDDELKRMFTKAWCESQDKNKAGNAMDF